MGAVDGSSNSTGQESQTRKTSTKSKAQNLSQLTFYAEDSLANQFPLQENVVGLMMKGGSGTSSTGLFASLDQDGSWLKTSQGSFQ